MCQSSIKYRGLIRGDLTEPFRKGLAYSVYQQRFFHDFKGLIRLLFCHILAYLEVRKYKYFFFASSPLVRMIYLLFESQ